jgi:uncharacterized protein (TIGR02996 family)
MGRAKTPSAELLELLKGAREAPNDLSRRGLVADWLAGHDESDRAELVRIQCQIATMANHAPSYYDLVSREAELLNRNDRTWLGPLAAYPCTFERGMVRLELTAAEFVAPKLARLATTETWAWVETLRLSGIEAQHGPALAGSPLLRSITSLDLAGTALCPEVVRMLGQCPALAGLLALSLNGTSPTFEHGYLADEWLAGIEANESPPRLGTLDLTASGMSTPAAEILAASPLLKDVTHLKLGKTTFGDRESSTRLARSKHTGNLQSLDLGECRILPDGIRALAASKGLTNLTQLDLSSLDLPAAIAGKIAASKAWPRLRSLNLYWNRKLGPSAAKQLANHPWSFPLRELNLSYAGIADKGMAALAAAPHVRSLEVLNLTGNAINPNGAAALAASPHFAGLVELDLSGNSIGPDGLAALAASPHLAGLKKLSLCHCDLGAGCIQAIAASPPLRGLVHLSLNRHGSEREDYNLAVEREDGLPNLRRLSLEGLAWNAQTVPQLLSLPFVPHLRELRLGNFGTGDGWGMLAECPHLANLMVLDLSGVNVGDQAAHVLAASPILRRLAVLNLGHNVIEPCTAEALLSSANLPSLRRLILVGGRLEEFVALRQRFPSRLDYTYFEYPSTEDE